MMICTGMRCPMQFGFDTNRCTANDCPYRTEPMTNADKIRSMSDEELAVITMCPNCFGAEIDCYHAGSCVECTTKWLKQPAEETPRIVWPHDEPVCQKMDEKIRRLDDKLRGDSCV